MPGFGLMSFSYHYQVADRSGRLQVESNKVRKDSSSSHESYHFDLSKSSICSDGTLHHNVSIRNTPKANLLLSRLSPP